MIQYVVLSGDMSGEGSRNSQIDPSLDVTSNGIKMRIRRKRMSASTKTISGSTSWRKGVLMHGIRERKKKEEKDGERRDYDDRMTCRLESSPSTLYASDSFSNVALFPPGTSGWAFFDSYQMHLV